MKNLVAELELKRFRENSNARSLYSQARDLLVRSGFLNFLRSFARPYAINQGANPYQSAYMAAFCEGYQKCLDDILYFEDLYLNDLPRAKPIKPEYGALEIALSKGDLKKGEV